MTEMGVTEEADLTCSFPFCAKTESRKTLPRKCWCGKWKMNNVPTIMDAAQASKVSFNGLSLCCSGIMSFGTHPVVFQEGWVRFKVVHLFPESLQMFFFNPVLIVALLCHSLFVAYESTILGYFSIHFLNLI